jgi:hypothetical protein
MPGLKGYLIRATDGLARQTRDLCAIDCQWIVRRRAGAAQKRGLLVDDEAWDV